MQISKITAKCRSFEFSIRHIRRFLNVRECSRVIQGQIILCLTYGAPVWSHNHSCVNRGKLKSTYFQLIRVMLRDFDYKLIRSRMLMVSGLESIGNLLMKRTYQFLSLTLYSTYYLIICVLSYLAGHISMSKNSGSAQFFDTSATRARKTNVLNQTKNITDACQFDWLDLSPQSFKIKLREHMSVMM